jgi:hypothetical protein
MTARRKDARPMPADFAEIAPTRRVVDLAAHYGCARAAVYRWLADAAIAPPERHDKRKVPADFRERAQSSSKAALGRHYSIHVKVIERWLRETGVRPQRGTPGRKAAPQPSRVHTFNKQAPRRAAAPLAGRDEEAAQYLRRRFPSVHHCTESGAADPKGKFWRVGLKVLTAEDLVAKAQARGWDPDEWRRIAA